MKSEGQACANLTYESIDGQSGHPATFTNHFIGPKKKYKTPNPTTLIYRYQLSGLERKKMLLN